LPVHAEDGQTLQGFDNEECGGMPDEINTVDRRGEPVKADI
jgi:hypothetical protein